ncbi:dolichyl-P-Man:Man(6)GlcNAc(2)-PP-dolichol alpha-1,2-mannosyltransferase Ecym_6468 [Eremothecium cymbalariae DBVPG|uniref:Mannosyltransferase n=1 Tax=Eremothecium cymbalariae (strain CBS 270.75 / DBVPG 7215 / KCTC 17166 / NRRL Y-17582) TaxID=931890 RepID=G8JUQ9_ERECY|nr:hypothetical protein Ecym_6468 [Eremothecium cymbalariae DBVPG\
MSLNYTTALLFIALVISRLYVQPNFSLISDCDETFNYWEPLNLLVRGFGKQTWEYSPEYSIRSWTFLLPFYGVLSLVKKVADRQGWAPRLLFYVARVIFGLMSTVFEKKLYTELLKSTNSEVANLWLLFQILNPGWFHASVEFLPSSFAMIFLLGYLKDSLRYLSTGKEKPFVSALFYNVVAGILGWPFVLVLSVPLVLHYLLSHRIIDTLRTGVSSVLVLVMVVATVFTIDSIFYRKYAPVPWNIVMYNVLNASEESGPNIFGTEPWYYYILNLLLNFPLPILFFAVIGLLHTNLWPIWGSIFVWFSVFFTQPHKEERFIYPVYAFITLASSIGFAKCTRLFGRRKYSYYLLKILVFGVLVVQSITRILALTTNYTAPLAVYSELTPNRDPINVCTGREWYHYPSSFFLPDNHRLRFVSSGFDGLLPGDFLEGSIFEAVSNLPLGMNNQNKFDEGKLVSIDSCHYYVDVLIPSNNDRDVLDPTLFLEDWTKVRCEPFIDVRKSRFFGRAFILPGFLVKYLPQPLKSLLEKYHKATYLEYCLFKRAGVLAGV